MPLPLAPLMAVLPSVFQGITGLGQRQRGQRMLDKLERPTYEMPEETLRSAALSRQAFADPTTPGQQLGLQQAGLSASNAMQAALQGGGGLAAVSAIQAQQDLSTGQIAAQTDAFKLQQLANYQANLGQVAQGRDLEFQMNKFAPYSQSYNEGREMVGAGTTNLMGALGGIANVGMAMMLSDMGKEPTVKERAAADMAKIDQVQQQNGYLNTAMKDAFTQAAQWMNDPANKKQLTALKLAKFNMTPEDALQKAGTLQQGVLRNMFTMPWKPSTIQ
jgi:hypothetical protein